MQDASSIALILINYFNDKEIINFFDSQLKNQKGAIELHIVNNGSHAFEELTQSCIERNISLIDANKNLGYLGGFLFAIERMPAPKPPWIILSNSDIEFFSENMIEAFVKKKYDVNIVMVGPSIISSRTKNDQNPLYKNRISISKLKTLKIVFSNYLFYLIYQSASFLKNRIKSLIVFRSHSATTTKEQDVYAIHGSFMIIKTSFIEKHFNILKQAPFLFGEEIVFAEVALKNNNKIIFDPSLKIIHHEHSTTGLFKSFKTVRHLKASVDWMIKNRHNTNSPFPGK